MSPLRIFSSDKLTLQAHAIARLGGITLVDATDFTMGVTNRTPEFLAKFPLGKVPCLETADGFYLTEGQAIARFLAESGSKADQLVGADAKTRAKVEEWSCFAEQELTANIVPPLIMTVFKMVPFDEGRYGTCLAGLERAVKRVEAELEKREGKKFLVGEELTLADIMVAGALSVAARFYMDEEMREGLQRVKGWLEGLWEIEEIKGAFGPLEFCEKRMRA